MMASPEPPGLPAPTEARRAGRELVLEFVFRPVSRALVPLARRTGVSPPAIVLANGVTGLAAALVLALGELLAAAVLLQLKTILDNTDGELARATGRVTLAGRYLDTVVDLVVNAVVFAALGYVTGQPLLAIGAFVALTLVLAADFNATELYRESHGIPTPQPPATGTSPERALASVYGAVFAPLDRLFRRAFGHAELDQVTVTALANLGLSTQLLALGVCLALDVPEAYLWLAVACLLIVGLFVARQERRARTAL